MSEEWGPWVDHDGKGCPCAGMVVHAKRYSAPDIIGVAGSHCIAAGTSPDDPYRSAWVWVPPGVLVRGSVLRYRIRKPRGMTILEELLVNLPERVDA